MICCPGSGAGRLNARETALSLSARVRPVLISVALLGAASSVTGQTPLPHAPLLAGPARPAGARQRRPGFGRARARDGRSIPGPCRRCHRRFLESRRPELPPPPRSLVRLLGRPLESLDSHSRPTSRRTGGTARAPDFFAATYPFELGRAIGSAQVSFQRMISFQEGSNDHRDSFLRHGDRPGGERPALVRRRPSAAADSTSSRSGAAWPSARTLRVGATVNRWFNGYHQTLRHGRVALGISHQEFRLRLLGLELQPRPDLEPQPRAQHRRRVQDRLPGASPPEPARRDPFIEHGELVPPSDQASSDGLGSPIPARTFRPRSGSAAPGGRAARSRYPSTTRERPGPRARSTSVTSSSSARTGARHHVRPASPIRPLDTSGHAEGYRAGPGGLEYVFIRGRLKVPVRSDISTTGSTSVRSQLRDDRRRTAPWRRRRRGSTP